MDRKFVNTFEKYSREEYNKKCQVTIRPYSKTSKYLGVFDECTGERWANEKFKDEEEARSFIEQNNLKLKK
jgi:hypothetical protein